MRLTISSEHATQLRKWADLALPAECCGLLYGKEACVTGIELTANVAENPLRHFEIEPARLIAAMRAARGGAVNVIGHFHSHPIGNAVPSEHDACSAEADGRYWLIVAGNDIRAWKAFEKDNAIEFAEVELVVEG